MPGIPTEHLAEQIQETNRRLVESNGRLADEIHGLASELRESNQRLMEAIGGLSRDFGDFRAEVARELGAIRAEAAKESGSVRAEMATINGTLKQLDDRLGHSLSVARWTVGILTPVIISLIGAAFGLAWYAGRLDSRVEHIEKTIGAAEKPGTARR